MNSTPKTLKLGPFTPGMDNRRPDFKLRQPLASGATHDFLRSAVNVNITEEGSLKRRDGYERRIAGTRCHSFWSDGVQAFFVDGPDLKRVTGSADLPILSVLMSGLTPYQRMSYAKLPDGSVLMSNGVVFKQWKSDALHDYPQPMLSLAPVIFVSSGGSLPAGIYKLCFTTEGFDGVESGSTTPVSVEVPAGGAISVTGLPAMPASNVKALRVYMSTPGGALPMFAARLTWPLSNLTISVQSGLGGTCSTYMLRPLPAGSIIRVFLGRVLSVVGNMLFYSEPYVSGLYNPMRGYIALAAPISIVCPCQGGVYVVADRTYWLSGDIGNTKPDEKLPYGAVPGTDVELHTGNCLWMSTRGVVHGSSTGELRNVQEEHVVVPAAGSGAALFREHDGMRQYVAPLFGARGETASAYSYMEAEVIRKGTVL